MSTKDFTFAEGLGTIKFFDENGVCVASVMVGSPIVEAITTGISSIRGTLKDRTTGEFIVGTLDQLLDPAG